MDSTKRTYDNLLNFSSLSVHRNAIYGFAALWIVCFHYVDMGMKLVGFPAKYRFVWDSFQMGNIGVDIFLFLSGVGLYYSFVKDHRILPFYYKRLIRIIVPYVLLCVPYMTYLLIAGEFTLGKYLKNVTTIFYWTKDTGRLNLWYVPAILVLYLAYPLIHKLLFFSKKGALVRCLLLAGVSMAVTYFAWFNAREGFYTDFDKFLPRVTVFILGCYIGKPVYEKRDFSAWLIPVAMAILFFSYPLYTRAVLKGADYRYYGSLTGIALVFLLATLFEVLKSIRLGRIFAFFGGFSLEIYLLHIEARNWYTHSAHYGEHPMRWYALLALGALIVAYLASKIEKPIVKLLLKPLNKQKE